MSLDIDFVVTWVDGNDPKLIQKRKKYQNDYNDVRFRDYGIFKYWFRAIEKYAPWVRNIYLITDNQVPNWLNTKAPKIKIVDHTEIIDSKYLPTFNSNVIELNINHISGLAEHFVVFNDDIFLNNYVSREDFFNLKNGLPKDIAAQNAIMPIEDFDHITTNNMITINKKFNKKNVLLKNPFKYFNLKYGYWNVLSLCLLPWPRFTRFIDPHIPFSLLKRNFNAAIASNTNAVQITQQNKFRNSSDVSINIVRYYQLASGNFEPRKYNFGKKYNLDQIDRIISDIDHNKHKVLCINDTNKITDNEFNQIKDRLKNVYSKKFPLKSSFEK